MLSAGDVIGEWLVEELLGEGSMGVVYRCRDREHRAILSAVKVARPKLPPRALKRFRREVELLKQLQHKAIVQFYSQGTDKHSGLHWFAMELLEGMTLRHRLQYGPLPFGHALVLFTEIAEGLAYAHEQNIFHRDLKPSNLFLCRDGTTRILDFGTGLATELSPLTGGSQEMGTYAYMPPEIFQGKRYEPALGDVYGIGLVFYELLIGQEVFLQPLPQMTSLKLHAGPLDPGVRFPTELRQLIISATHPEPRLRISTMKELADRLLELSLEHPAPEEPVYPAVVTPPRPRAERDDDSKVLTPLAADTSPIIGEIAPALTATTTGSGGWWLGTLPGPVSRSEIVELITSHRVKASTPIARPGSVWREIRYHPNFRDYFTPGTEAYELRHEAPEVEPPPEPEPTRSWRRPLTAALVGAMIIAGVAVLWPEPELAPSQDSVAIGMRAAGLREQLRAKHPTPQGDPEALLAAGITALEAQTAEGERAALAALEPAVLLSEDPRITATMAEASARLARTEPLLVSQARLALMVALDQGASPADLAPTRVALALADGRLEKALETAVDCEAPIRCELMIAEARRDLEALDDLETRRPDLTGVSLVRLRVLIARQDWLAVRALSLELKRRFSQEALPHYGLALSAAVFGEGADFEQAIEQGTLLAPGWLTLRHLHARHLIQQQQGELAVGMLQSLIEDPGFPSYPDSGAVWRDQVVAAQLTHDFDLEVEAATQACRTDPMSPLGWMQKAWVLSRAADPDGARRALEAVDLSGLTGAERARLGLLMARLLEATAYDLAAIDELRAVTAVAPAAADVWLALSGMALRQGSIQEAALALEQAALQDNLQNTELLWQLWSPPVDLRPDREALEAAILKDDALAARSRSLLGIHAWMLKDTRAAETLLRQARAQEPTSAAVLSALGQLMLDQGEYREAARALGESVRMEPGRPAVVAMYSYAMAAAGERTTADRLSDLYKTTDSTTVYWKAKALLQLGEVEQARRTLEEQIPTGGLTRTSWQLLAELYAQDPGKAPQ
jgi:serine/threonine protein kinase/tetratricopeptide (TPR) repeat protein